MAFVHLETKEEVSEATIRARFSIRATSFAYPMSDSDAASVRYARITETDKPTFDPLTHRCEKVPTTSAADPTVREWVVVALTQAEIDAAYALTVPQIVSMAQARKALSHAGLLATIDAAIAGMAGTAGDDARIDWSTANELWRTGALVQGVGASIGLTSAQIDALFIAAAAITP
jgi:hypothetical protein